MSGTRPDETGGQAEWLPRRALVSGSRARGRRRRSRSRGAGSRSSRPTGRRTPTAGRLADAGVEVRLGSEEESLLEGVELVVKSPGVPAGSPLAVAARARGIPIWSEVELGYRLLPGNPLIGVTGTNGKTTTTELLGAILRAAGRSVEVAGNVGRALTGVAEEIEPGATVVCELSSFQLEDVHELACDVAVLLNLEPDHLDRHGTLRRVPRREAAHLRARAHEDRAARAWASTASSSPPTIRCRPSRSSPACTTARTPPRRRQPRGRQASATTRSRRRFARSRASRTGSSSCASCAASATSTTPRRRTPQLPVAASQPMTRRCASSSAARSRARTSRRSRASCPRTCARST